MLRPVWAHVDVPLSGATFGAYDLSRKRRHFDRGRVIGFESEAAAKAWLKKAVATPQEHSDKEREN